MFAMVFDHSVYQNQQKIVDKIISTKALFFYEKKYPRYEKTFKIKHGVHIFLQKKNNWGSMHFTQIGMQKWMYDKKIVDDEHYFYAKIRFIFIWIIFSF